MSMAPAVAAARQRTDRRIKSEFIIRLQSESSVAAAAAAAAAPQSERMSEIINRCSYFVVNAPRSLTEAIKRLKERWSRAFRTFFVPQFVVRPEFVQSAVHRSSFNGPRTEIVKCKQIRLPNGELGGETSGTSHRGHLRVVEFRTAYLRNSRNPIRSHL